MPVFVGCKRFWSTRYCWEAKMHQAHALVVFSGGNSNESAGRWCIKIP